MLQFENKLVILAIMDGWGLAPDGPGNAISLAKLPNYHKLLSSFPHSQLKASGNAVGLPRDEAGNTETGHLNLGAGRIVYQDLERINLSIANGSFFNNSTLMESVNHAVKNNSNLHLMGLIGSGGVHSNIEHLLAIINFVSTQNFNRLYLHLFTDGRDSPPTSSMTYINTIAETLVRLKIGKIATIMGRYWAMDRDRRWDRTAKAYFALTKGEGVKVKSPEEAVKLSYSEGKTDEFIDPSVITDATGSPTALIADNDSIIFFNFRIDRPRQLTSAFIVNDFSDKSVSLDFDPFLERYKKTHIQNKVLDYHKIFDRGEKLKNIYFATMTQYSKTLVDNGAQVIIYPDKVNTPIGRVLAENNLKQLRVSESEKERFVTFYFNGQREIPFPGEDRIIVPSPNVPTYDKKPEMSAFEMTEKTINHLKTNQNYSFVLINYANCDMVGHSGSIGATVKACEVVDECLGNLMNFILAYGGTLIVTADHGNAEEKINPHTGQISTEHTINPVPFILVSKKYLGKCVECQSGILADVATTVLSILNIPIPEEMTGRNLLFGVPFN